MSHAYPTNYFRIQRRDIACPSMVLQQWWPWSRQDALDLIPPWAPQANGEWRDLPVVPQDITAETPV